MTARELEIRDLKTRISLLEDALKPFAKIAESLKDSHQNEDHPLLSFKDGFQLWKSHFVLAKKVLEKL